MTTKGNEGQSALVTGASGGIGLELARVLAANRFSLVLLARSRDKLEDLARELGAQHGTKVTIVPADLSEPGAAQAVFDSLTDAGVQIDRLVNNAGLLLEGRFGAAWRESRSMSRELQTSLQSNGSSISPGG
jgi:uncharacterized protein